MTVTADLSGKVAAVTGASSGIGEATVQRHLQRVIVAALRKVDGPQIAQTRQRTEIVIVQVLPVGVRR